MGTELADSDEQQDYEEKIGSGRNAGPLRLCAVTRQSLDPSELVRFVASPDGIIVPDLAKKLPGRGVWVIVERLLLERAIKQNVFAKSLKRQVKVPDGLADAVDVLLMRRSVDALSLAKKTGAVITGATKIDIALEKGAVAVLMHGLDAAIDGRNKLDRKYCAIAAANGREARIFALLTIEQMSLAIGGQNVVHAGLNHGGAAEKYAAEAARLVRFRSGSSVLDAVLRSPPTTLGL
jgi:uncharacterized protein